MKGAKSRAYRSAPERQAHGELQAEKWLEAGLAAAGLRVEDLAALKGSHPSKVALALLLWKRTTVSQGWIAERLAMKSAANAGQVIRQAAKAAPMSQHLPRKLREFLEQRNMEYAH